MFDNMFGLIVGVVVGLIAIGIIIWFIAIYNGLIQLKNNIDKSWSNINVMLKQRMDELTKLIQVVKGYKTYERKVLTEITSARTAWAHAKTIQEKAAASNQISEALKTVFAVAENYPQLKANENFKQLQERITGLENEIADRREFYNDSVNTFNIRIQSIPDMWIASLMKLQRKDLFKTTAEETKDVKIDLS